MRSVSADEVTLARQRAAAEGQHHLADRGRVGDARPPESGHADDARARRHRVDGDRLALARERERRRLAGASPSSSTRIGRARACDVEPREHAVGERHERRARAGTAPGRRAATIPADSSVASSRDAVLALTPIRRASSLTPRPCSRCRGARSSSARARATEATGRAPGPFICCTIGNSIASAPIVVYDARRMSFVLDVSALRRPRGGRLRLRRRGDRAPARAPVVPRAVRVQLLPPQRRRASSASGGITAPGCRTWFLAERDTRTNEVLRIGLPGELGDREPSEPAAAQPGERIDRDQTITFTFDGKHGARRSRATRSARRCTPPGTRTFSRSFKYHRRRGLMCCAGQCPNCLVAVDGAPGVRACTEPVRERRSRSSTSTPARASSST